MEGTSLRSLLKKEGSVNGMTCFSFNPLQMNDEEEANAYRVMGQAAGMQILDTIVNKVKKEQKYVSKRRS
jgi:hypothetical protein